MFIVYELITNVKKKREKKLYFIFIIVTDFQLSLKINYLLTIIKKVHTLYSLLTYHKL